MFTEQDFKLVRFFSNKYERMAVEARLNIFKGGIPAAKSLEKSAQAVLELIDKMEEVNKRYVQGTQD